MESGYRTRSIPNSTILVALGMPVTAEWNSDDRQVYFFFADSEKVNRLLDSCMDGHQVVNAKVVLNAMRQIRLLLYRTKPAIQKSNMEVKDNGEKL